METSFETTGSRRRINYSAILVAALFIGLIGFKGYSSLSSAKQLYPIFHDISLPQRELVKELHDVGIDEGNQNQYGDYPEQDFVNSSAVRQRAYFAGFATGAGRKMLRPARKRAATAKAMKYKR